MNRKERIRQLSGYMELMKMSGISYVGRTTERKEDDTPVPTENPGHPLSDREKPAGLLERIRFELGDCHRCRLGQTSTRLVFGAGSPDADLLFVGEAPGRDEDLKGEPFVGRAGQLLTRIIQAIDLRREDVYICNVIKCRPPENRNPLPEEIESCEPFLLKQVEAIKPKVICALGKFAAQTLLRTDAPISTLRGRFHDYHGIPLMPTYHPAYLLRNPKMKREVWEDVQKIQRKLRGS